MKLHQNPFLRFAASLALLGSSAHAADVTLSSGTYTDTQSYDNGTIGPGENNTVTFNSGANYSFSGNLNLPVAWNRIILNSGASLSVGGNLSADVSGVSLNGGTLTTGGLLLHDSPNWAGTLNDGKVSIEKGDSIINGATIVANLGLTPSTNANFISLASSPGGYSGSVANNLWLGNDGATIDSNGHNIGITMALGNFTGQTGTLTKTGAGTLTLTAANTYSGATLVTGGVLQLGTDNSFNPQFGALENSSLLTIESGATVRVMGSNAFKGWGGGNMNVTLNGGTLTINDGLTASGNHKLGTVILNGGEISGAGGSAYGSFNLTGSVTVTNDSTISASRINTENGNRTISVSADKTLTWSGEISNGSSSGSGTTSLTFNGAGTTVLAGENTYSGSTSVTAGKLIVNGNISTSTTTVSGTGTLGGSGTGGAVSVLAGGTLAPGNSIDSLDIAGALTLGPGSFSVFEINTLGNISDLAIVSGLLTFGGTLNVSNIGSAVVNGDTFDLFNWGSKSGTFSAVNLPGLDTGLMWDESQLYSNGTITVIPEPHAVLLGGLGLLALLRRRR